MCSVLEAVYTFLSFCCVVLGGVGGLSHVWAGLWRHTGLHRVSFPLSLFVTLWTSTGNICYIILEEKRGGNNVFKLVFNSGSDQDFLLIMKYRVNPQCLHLVSSLLCNGQELFWVWEGIHNCWDRKRLITQGNNTVKRNFLKSIFLPHHTNISEAELQI